MTFCYQIDYGWLDGVQGWGQQIGTYMAWGVNNSGWWGECEIKFLMDAPLRPRD
jgi:D-arabinan exo alpha-(1,3)/(1,5)-arabinofuranosidase (non-reducing end)